MTFIDWQDELYKAIRSGNLDKLYDLTSARTLSLVIDKPIPFTNKEVKEEMLTIAWQITGLSAQEMIVISIDKFVSKILSRPPE